MKCDWTNAAEPDERGWRRVRCLRCGQVSGKTPHPFEKIHAMCTAWPRWHELGYWASLLLEVVGLSKQRWGWLWWKIGFAEPCGCGNREKWLNSLPGKLAMLWRSIRGSLFARERQPPQT